MSELSRVTRYPERASEDRALLDELFDEVMVATVSSVIDGQPWSLPTFCARDGDRVLVHGSTGSGLMRHLATGASANLTIFSLDAVVVAESAFESSANYRSAVLRGTFARVADGERDHALRVLTDRLIPGRTAEVAANTSKEIAATAVLALPIEADNWIYKSSSGASGQPDPIVPDVWVGIVPMRLIAGDPVKDSWVADEIAVPPSVEALIRRHSCS